jgi:nucleotide-binding universal stress UspA family protein
MRRSLAKGLHSYSHQRLAVFALKSVAAEWRLTMKIKHILFPVDFSESSHALIPEVEWVANKFDSDVTLMHVFEILIAWYGTVESPMMSPPCCEELRGSAKQRLLDYPIRLAENRVNRVFAEGDAAWNIKNWVEEHDVDLIMMGTHGYGSLRRLLARVGSDEAAARRGPARMDPFAL